MGQPLFGRRRNPRRPWAGTEDETVRTTAMPSKVKGLPSGERHVEKVTNEKNTHMDVGTNTNNNDSRNNTNLVSKIRRRTTKHANADNDDNNSKLAGTT